MGQYSGDERGKAKSWAHAWEIESPLPAKIEVLRPAALREANNLAINNSNVVVYWRPAEHAAAAPEPQHPQVTLPSAPPPTRDRLRHGASVALAALVCANAAALLTGWSPSPRSAQASVLVGEHLVGEWRGDCRSGETRQSIRLQVDRGVDGYALHWSRFSYDLEQSNDGLSWIALRAGARVGDVALEGKTLHVKMENFRCCWIAARRD